MIAGGHARKFESKAKRSRVPCPKKLVHEAGSFESHWRVSGAKSWCEPFSRGNGPLWEIFDCEQSLRPARVSGWDVRSTARSGNGRGVPAPPAKGVGWCTA